MDAIEHVLSLDSARPVVQSVMIEIVPIVRACAYALERLDAWTSPENPHVDPIRGSWDINVYPVPKGVVLLITWVDTHSLLVSMLLTKRAFGIYQALEWTMGHHFWPIHWCARRRLHSSDQAL